MRRRNRTLLSEELTDTVEQVRGSTPVDEYVREAVEERLMRDRFIHGRLGTSSMDDIYAAVILEDDGREGVLLMRMHLPGLGDTMMPVLAGNDETMEEWTEKIALELGMMDGPPVRWRKWVKEGSVELDYLRRESPE